MHFLEKILVFAQEQKQEEKAKKVAVLAAAMLGGPTYAEDVGHPLVDPDPC